MKTPVSRRNILKTIAAFTLGGMTEPVIAKKIWSNTRNLPVIEPEISVLPPGPNSVKLVDRVKKVIGKTNYTGLYGVAASSGKGVYLTDVDNNSYIDCLAAASTNILGYDKKEVAEAYYESAVKIPNSAFGYTPNQETVDLAEALIKVTPGKFPKKVMLGVSGSDANGGAIEVMRRYSGKMGLISFNYAYHGSTGLSQQASGFSGLKTGIYQNSPDFIKMEFPTSLKQRDKILKNIESVLAWGTVGGVLVEPIQGDAGIVVPYEGFFTRLTDILHENDVLLIDDEVQSGMGRTGKWWAIEHEGIVPDLIIAGKGLSGGYAPISALIGRAEVIDSLDPAQQIFTYTGHGPSAAAASKVIQIIQEEDIVKNADESGAHLLAGLKEAVKNYPDIFIEARGRGLMLGLEINMQMNEFANKIFAFRCLEKGIYFGYFGPNQNVIRIEPPLVLSKNEADTIIKVVYEVADEMKKNRIPAGTIDKVKKYALGWQ